ncbi:30S ribosomal protein S7 [Candidatus Kuenenbacteria bacterium]|nr:30S ribosomal protein S7 [Candidatus Kuenenbacteria bacterium]
MRGKQSPKRKIKPDVKYHRLDISKLINYIMRDGKKAVAEKIVYDALDYIAGKTKEDPMATYEFALRNVAPALEVRGRRVGGANYQVPFPVSDDRRQVLSFRWIIAAAKSRKGRPMAHALADELLDAAKGEGSAVKKREDMHRMAESNKAFAHFARFTKKKR